MAAMDRFGGPEAWDAYCETKDEIYAASSRGMTCLDCAECVQPEGAEFARFEGIGWCLDIHEFVSDGATIAELGVECFVGR